MRGPHLLWPVRVCPEVFSLGRGRVRVSADSIAVVWGLRGPRYGCGVLWVVREAHAGAVGDVAEFVGVVRFTVSAAEVLDHRLVMLGYLEVDDVALGFGEGGWFGVVAVYAGGEDVAQWGVGCFHCDVAGCLYCGGVDFLPVDGPAGGFEEFVEEDSLCAGVAVSERVQDGGFAPVVGESVDGAVFRESLGKLSLAIPRKMNAAWFSMCSGRQCGRFMPTAPVSRVRRVPAQS